MFVPEGRFSGSGLPIWVVTQIRLTEDVKRTRKFVNSREHAQQPPNLKNPVSRDDLSFRNFGKVILRLCSMFSPETYTAAGFPSLAGVKLPSYTLYHSLFSHTGIFDVSHYKKTPCDCTSSAPSIPWNPFRFDSFEYTCKLQQRWNGQQTQDNSYLLRQRCRGRKHICGRLEWSRRFNCWLNIWDESFSRWRTGCMDLRSRLFLCTVLHVRMA